MARREPWRSVPVILHVVSLVVAFAVLLYLDRNLWFFEDEWDFILNRGLHHPVVSIWQPHNEHWSTLPILLWRLLFTIFSLRTYIPYECAALLCHVVVAHLIWRRCRRDGVNTWIALVLVAIFLFSGAGAENLTWAFQIGFIAPIAFGYLGLELLERRQGSRIWDQAAGVVFLASLMCSAVGDSFLVVAAVVLVRGGDVRRSLRVLWLPVLSYAIWYERIGHQSVRSDHITVARLYELPAFLWTGLSTAFGQTLGLDSAGPALLVVLLVWALRRSDDLYRSSATALSCALGAVAFLLLTGAGRAADSGVQSSASRYSYVVLALVIPLIGLALNDVRRPQTAAVVGAAGVLILVLVSNVGTLRSFAASRTAQVDAEKAQIVTTATLLDDGSGSITQTPIAGVPSLSPAILVRLERQGRLPRQALSRLQTLDAEVLLEVGITSNRTAASEFRMASSNDVVASTGSSGCTVFQPSGSGPQVSLVPSGTATSSEITAPAGSELVVFLLSANNGQASLGEPLAVPPSGTGYLSEVAGGHRVTLSLPTAGDTTICLG